MVILWADAMNQLTSGWTLIHRVEVPYDPAGTPKSGNTSYTGIKMSIKHTTASKIEGTKGTRYQELIYAVIPIHSLTEIGIVPRVNYTFLEKDGVRWRTVGLLDLSDDPYYMCYNLTLEKDRARRL